MSGIFDFDGGDSSHPDLSANADPSQTFKYYGSVVDPTTMNSRSHGTSVAGVISGQRDGTGGVGVAYDSQFTVVPLTYYGNSENANYIVAGMAHQYAFDVVNLSWEYAPFWLGTNKPLYTGIQSGIALAANAGRGGLGTAVVVAAGNDRKRITISDGNARGDARTFQIAAGVDIETVTQTLDSSTARSSDLTILLTSPSGTKSELMRGNGANSAINGWAFSSNAFMGEASAGAWTLRIIDNAAGQTASDTTATLDVFGAQDTADDTYVYADEFGSNQRLLVEGAPSVLNDASGHDLINAAAVTRGSWINLVAGTQSTIASRTLTINGTMEDAVGGDGADYLFGNAQADELWGMRGNDTLSGYSGNDVLHGGPATTPSTAASAPTRCTATATTTCS